jgi:hypothetical protein
LRVDRPTDHRLHRIRMVAWRPLKLDEGWEVYGRGKLYVCPFPLRMRSAWRFGVSIDRENIVVAACGAGAAFLSSTRKRGQRTLVWCKSLGPGAIKRARAGWTCTGEQPAAQLWPTNIRTYVPSVSFLVGGVQARRRQL